MSTAAVAVTAAASRPHLTRDSDCALGRIELEEFRHARLCRNTRCCCCGSAAVAGSDEAVQGSCCPRAFADGGCQPPNLGGYDGCIVFFLLGSGCRTSSSMAETQDIIIVQHMDSACSKTGINVHHSCQLSAVQRAAAAWELPSVISHATARRQLT